MESLHLPIDEDFWKEFFDLPDEIPKTDTSSSRCELVSTDELATCSVGFVPANAIANTNSALGNFNRWIEWRNERAQKPNDIVPEDVLLTDSASSLNKLLSCYICETKKNDGSRFPPNTITLLLQGLKHERCQSICTRS